MSGNIKFINKKNEKIQLPSKGEWGNYFSREKTSGKDNALLKFANSFVQERTKDVMENEFPDLANNIIQNKDDVVKLKKKLIVQQEPADDKNCSVYTISRKPDTNPDAFNEEEVSKIITENDALKQENDILKAKDRLLKDSYQVEKNAFNESIAGLSRPNGVSTNQKEEPSQHDINRIVKDNTYLNDENTLLRKKVRDFEESQQERKQTGEASTNTEEPETISTSEVVTEEPLVVSNSTTPNPTKTMTKEEKRQLIQAEEDFKLLFYTLYNKKPNDSIVSGMSLSDILAEIEKLKNEARTKILERAIAYDTSVDSRNFKERNFSETNAAKANKLAETVDSLVVRYKLAFPKSSVAAPKFGGKSRRRSKRRCYTHKKSKTRRYRKRSFSRRNRK